MDLITPITAGVLLALFTAIQTWISKGRFDALERQMDRLNGDVRGVGDRGDVRMDSLGARMDAHEEANERRFEQLSADIAQLRSDLLQVVLALTPKQQTG